MKILILSAGFLLASAAAQAQTVVPLALQPEVASDSEDAPIEKKIAFDIGIAATPEEFRCEALQVNDFEQVQISLTALHQVFNEAFEIEDRCIQTNLTKPENRNNLSLLIDNIQGGVSTLRGQLANHYIESIASMATGGLGTDQAIEISTQGQAQAKEAVKLVVDSIKDLNTILEKNPLNISSGKSCKAHYSSTERLVFGVAELVEDVSPLLIQVVSKVPGLQEMAPMVIGASMVSSAITQYAEVAQKRIDLNKSENRTAILVNTCQIIKTYNKMRLLRGLQTNPQVEKGRIDTMVDSQASAISKKLEYLKQQDQGPKNMGSSAWTTAITEQNKNYKELQAMQSRMNSGNAEEICAAQGQVQNLTENILSVYNQISQLKEGTASSALGETLLGQISKYKKALEQETSAKYCARLVRTLYAYVEAFNRKSVQELSETKKAHLAKDTALYQASANLDFLRSFQGLLEKMSTDNLFEKLQTSIAKTEAVLQQSKVLKAWFGNARKFYIPGVDQYRNPVMDWMNFYETQFLMLRKSFAKKAADFDMNLYELYKYYHPRNPKQKDSDYWKEFVENVRMKLDILNLKNLDASNVTINGRSSPHQRACSDLMMMRDMYKSMTDGWNTLKYFCQMMKPLFNEPEMSKALRVRCLGVDELVPDSKRNQLSGIDKLLEPVSADLERMPRIAKKIEELKCE